MKKLIRKWLGIDKDRECELRRMDLMCKAIDEIFGLEKIDSSVKGKINQIICRELK